MLKKWMPRRVVIQLLILLVVHCSSYYGAKMIIQGGPYNFIGSAFDSKIPLIPCSIIIYYGCFLFWVINYTNIIRNEPEGTYRFLSAEIIGKIVCFLTYVLFPTAIIRPEVTGTGFFSDVIRMMYSIDHPDALFPSMHCFVSWMCVVGMRDKPCFSKKYRIFSIVMAVLVFIATLTTKQHIVADVLAGIALAELSYSIAGHLPHRKANS